MKKSSLLLCTLMFFCTFLFFTSCTTSDTEEPEETEVVEETLDGAVDLKLEVVIEQETNYNLSTFPSKTVTKIKLTITAKSPVIIQYSSKGVIAKGTVTKPDGSQSSANMRKEIKFNPYGYNKSDDLEFRTLAANDTLIATSNVNWEKAGDYNINVPVNCKLIDSEYSQIFEASTTYKVAVKLTGTSLVADTAYYKTAANGDQLLYGSVLHNFNDNSTKTIENVKFTLKSYTNNSVTVTYKSGYMSSESTGTIGLNTSSNMNYNYINKLIELGFTNYDLSNSSFLLPLAVNPAISAINKSLSTNVFKNINIPDYSSERCFHKTVNSVEYYAYLVDMKSSQAAQSLSLYYSHNGYLSFSCGNIVFASNAYDAFYVMQNMIKGTEVYADQWIKDAEYCSLLGMEIIYITDKDYIKQLMSTVDEETEFTEEMFAGICSIMICSNTVISDFDLVIVYFNDADAANSCFEETSSLPVGETTEDDYSFVYGCAIYDGTQKSTATYAEILNLGAATIYDNILYTVNGDGDYIAELIVSPETEITFTNTVGEGENIRNVVGFGDNLFYHYKPYGFTINITTVSGLDLLDTYPEEILKTAWYKRELTGNEVIIIKNKLMRTAESMTDYVMPDNITEINDNCFVNYQGASITLSENLVKIGDNVLSGAINLTTINLTDCVNLTSFGTNFLKYSKIISLDLSALPALNMSSLPEGFLNNSYIKSIVLGENFNIFDKPLFSDCSLLTSITFNAVSPEISGYALYSLYSFTPVFTNCTDYFVTDGILYKNIEGGYKAITYINRYQTEFTTLEDTLIIDTYAFTKKDLSKHITINFNQKLKRIESYAIPTSAYGEFETTTLDYLGVSFFIYLSIVRVFDRYEDIIFDNFKTNITYKISNDTLPVLLNNMSYGNYIQIKDELYYSLSAKTIYEHCELIPYTRSNYELYANCENIRKLESEYGLAVYDGGDTSDNVILAVKEYADLILYAPNKPYVILMKDNISEIQVFKQLNFDSYLLGIYHKNNIYHQNKRYIICGYVADTFANLRGSTLNTKANNCFIYPLNERYIKQSILDKTIDMYIKLSYSNSSYQLYNYVQGSDCLTDNYTEGSESKYLIYNTSYTYEGQNYIGTTNIRYSNSVIKVELVSENFSHIVCYPSNILEGEAQYRITYNDGSEDLVTVTNPTINQGTGIKNYYYCIDEVQSDLYYFTYLSNKNTILYDEAVALAETGYLVDFQDNTRYGIYNVANVYDENYSYCFKLISTTNEEYIEKIKQNSQESLNVTVYYTYIKVSKA